MIKKIIYILLILLYYFNPNISTVYAKTINENIQNLIQNSIIEPDISAKSAILMDIDTGTIIYSKNENEIHYPASITKILTTLIALEYDKPNDIITFSDNAVFGIDRSSSHLAMDVAEQITMTDALYGIMLMSANEVSAAVAEHIEGSIEGFAKVMNERAKEAGALNSNFENPHGLHNPKHYTTAYDMAMISREAYKSPEFRKIISTLTYQIQPTNKQKEIRYLANQHHMYKNTIYNYDGCTGGKTGFTDEAQSTLVTFAERNGLKLLCVVLEEIGNVKYTDTAKLFDYGFDNFTSQTLYASDYPKSLPVYSNTDDKTHLGNTDIYVEEKNIDTIIPKNIDSSKIIQKINLSNELISPIEANSIIGTLDFYYDENLIYSTNLKNSQSFEYVAAAKIINNDISIQEKNTDFMILFIPLILILLLFLWIRAYRQKLRRRRWYATKRRRIK